MDSIMQNLETGVAELFSSDRYQDYLKTMSKFHNYSFNNTVLIAMQRPDATLVTGYRNWQSMGRQVKKGEKGITIIAPAPVKKKREREVLDEDQKPVIGEDGKPKTEEVEITLPYFKAITVFDIGQTTGEPIQTLAPEILTVAVEDFDLFLEAIRNISPVPIRFDEISGSANGYYHTVDKEIVIREGMSDSQTLKTAIHETAHARLHDRELMEDQGIEKDRLTKEVEAESVAYCVCSAFTLDTSEYSFPYIAGWSSGKDMKELKASMDVIRKTAGEMIDQLTEEIDYLIEEKQERAFLEGQEKWIPAVEAAGYRFDELESRPGHLNFVPDGTHEISGPLIAESWDEVSSWLEDMIRERNFQSERVERVLYPERFEHSEEELMFTENQSRFSIYQMDEKVAGREQHFMGLEEVSDFVSQRENALGFSRNQREIDILEDSACISFYAAECSEFPVLGEVHQDLSLPEALEAYEKIPSNRMNGIKSVGFHLQEGSDYDGMMDLMVGGRVQREFLDSIPYYKENKLVQAALKRVEQYAEEQNYSADRNHAEKEEKQKTKSQKRREGLSL